MVKGAGCYLWDAENRRYLDFTAGIAVNALGHCDPEMAKLLYQQVRREVWTIALFPCNPNNCAGSHTCPHLQLVP